MISSMPCSVSRPGSGCSAARSGRAASRLADARVVFHRAGAEQADAHHAQRLLRQMQVVALHLGLGELRQAGGARAAHRGRHQTLALADGLADAVIGGRETSGRGGRDGPAPSPRLVPDRPRDSGAAFVLLIADHLLERRGEAVDVVPGVDLGDAIERALAELREFARRDPCRRRCRAGAAPC